MLALHALAVAPVDGAESARRDPALQELLFLGLYERGIYTAPRGMVNMSLPLTDAQLEAALAALDDTLSELSARLG
jgi:glutamate-1-semialdehyde aminotransferase